MPAKKLPSACSVEETACESVPSVKIGKKILVTGSNNCVKSLAPDGCCLPAIPIQLNEKEVVLRDGSADKPIQLPCLQKSSSKVVPSLVFQQADGSITRWEAPQECGTFKMSIVNGMFSITEDTIPHIIPSDICKTTCDNIDYLLGVKITEIACPGQATKVMMQLMAVPKYACQDEPTSGFEI